MKQCPKCSIEHSKPGAFCSRTCANSRTFSDESKLKKSIANKGKPNNKERLSPEAYESWCGKIRERKLQAYLETPFEELGSQNKRRRVFEDQNHCCANCGISEWQGVKITLELEHKDGNNQNNDRENLEGLCPNCHSITDTWRGRNKPCRNGSNEVTDEVLLQCLNESLNIRQGLLRAGLSAKGNNYKRAKRLLGQ